VEDLNDGVYDAISPYEGFVELLQLTPLLKKNKVNPIPPMPQQ